MKIVSIVVDGSEQIVFRGHTTLEPSRLLQVAAKREALARQKGEQFVKEAIPVFAKKLVETAQRQELGEEINAAAAEVAMMAWLLESQFHGLTADAFAACDLEFTMFPGGVVRYDRRPAVA